MNQFRTMVDIMMSLIPVAITKDTSLTKAYGYPFGIAIVSFLLMIFVTITSVCLPSAVPESLLKNDFFSQNNNAATAGSATEPSKV
jgi:hypothetical protein